MALPPDPAGVPVPWPDLAAGTGVRVHPGVVDVVVLAPAAGEARARAQGRGEEGGAEARTAGPTGARPRGASRAPRPDPWQVLTLRRAEGTRCTGAWELVHGRIEPGERPEEAARRELFEETGFEAVRWYSITVHPFYLARAASIQLAIVFAAIVDAARDPRLGPEHDAARWRSHAAARRVLAWPREREHLRHAHDLLRGGDAGVLEDLLRLPSVRR